MSQSCNALTDPKESKCTCPCLDCIEGNHCGGEYWYPEDAGEDGPEPQLIGVCHHLTDSMAHDLGLVMEGCDCHRCRPELYEDDEDPDDDLTG